MLHECPPCVGTREGSPTRPLFSTLASPSYFSLCVPCCPYLLGPWEPLTEILQTRKLVTEMDEVVPTSCSRAGQSVTLCRAGPPTCSAYGRSLEEELRPDLKMRPTRPRQALGTQVP